MTDTPRDGPDAQRRGNRAVVVIVVLACALAALWAIARNVVLIFFAGTAPILALQFAPQSGPAAAQFALDRVVVDNGNVDAESRTLLETALRRDPLMGEPVILAGLQASATGDLSYARRLMEEARRRNPRLPIARFWLLDEYLRAGDYAAALEEIDPMLNLQPQGPEAIVALATSLVGVPEARPALVAKLRTNPRWRRAFFRQASASPSLSPQVPALLAAAPFRPGQPASVSEQEAIVTRVVRDQGYQSGYALWRDLLPDEQRGNAGPIYDGRFAGLPGSRPFNWHVPTARSGSVRLASIPGFPGGTALQVNYGTGRAATLAEQTVLLTPASYRLAFAVRRSEAPETASSHFVARLDCQAPRRSLARMQVDDIRADMAQRTLAFTVPQGCDAVRIQFRVEPSVEGGPLDIDLGDVRIERTPA